MTLLELKQALRAGEHAWPGGYPTFFIARDGGVLSFAAVRANLREVMRATQGTERGDPWAVSAHEVNWENGDLYCDHTGERIPSAYAED